MDKSPNKLNYFVVNNEDREFFQERFFLNPLLHVGAYEKEQTCICGKPIKKDFFIFSRQLRTDIEKQTLTAFTIGPTCAVRLCKILRLALPPQCLITRTRVSKKDLSHLAGWDKLNLEVYRAIQYICTLSGWLPSHKSKTFQVLYYLSRNAGTRTTPFGVKVANNLMGKMLPEHKSLIHASNDLFANKKFSPEILHFSECQKVLNELGIDMRL